MLYSAYNLNIFSSIELPELNKVTNVEAKADVIIEFRAISDAGIQGGEQIGPFLWVTPNSLWLQVPGVVRFLISNGNSIQIDPEPGIDEESIRVFLLGSAFGALLFQRGLLVLHGNAIKVGDHCMICVGHSGSGKSTLAAGFMQRGYQILADDVVPIDDDCKALPGFPRIKVWQDVADKLSIDTKGLKRIRPNIEKFNLPVVNRSEIKQLPVRWIYILGSHNQDSIELEPILGMQKFLPLRNNTYRLRFLDGMALKSDHLKRVGQLAGNIRLARITRPKAGFTLEDMIDTILNDIAENP